MAISMPEFCQMPLWLLCIEEGLQTFEKGAEPQREGKGLRCQHILLLLSGGSAPGCGQKLQCWTGRV